MSGNVLILHVHRLMHGHLLIDVLVLFDGGRTSTVLECTALVNAVVNTTDHQFRSHKTGPR